MPKHKNFVRVPIPLDLNPNEEVFLFKLTGEIFRNYEKYYERIILCNSLEWTCTLTGKTGLTYEEALESEENARKLIETFPKTIQMTIVYLVNELQKGNLRDLVDEIFSIIKDKYLIGEEIQVTLENTSKSKNTKLCKLIDIKHDSLDFIVETSSNTKYTVKSSQLSRPKNQLTKEKITLVIRNNCEVSNGLWQSKPNYDLSTFKIDKYFKGQLNVPVNNKKSQKQSSKIVNKKVIDMNENEFIKWRECYLDNDHELIQIENLIDKERLKEDQKRAKELEKELKKPKEDLDCVNSKDLPQPNKISSLIPSQKFGDALFILEFLSLFGNSFHLKNDFPNGFHLEHLEDALYSKRCTSSLCNLLLFYLDSIIKCNEEELNEANVDDNLETSDIQMNENEERIELDKLFKRPLDCVNDRESFVTHAQHFARLIKSIHGRNIFKIGLDDFTITEMIRLYYITCGGTLSDSMNKFLYQQRGGYSKYDELGIEFSLNYKDIIYKLENTSVFELESNEKLAILLNFTHQLMSQVKYRDILDENYAKLASIKAELRELQVEENKRLKEIKIQQQQKNKLEEVKTNIQASKDEKHNQMAKQDKEAAILTKRRDEFLKNEKKLENLIFDLQFKCSHMPLGRDRYFNRYWIFKSIDGLFIESDNGETWSFYSKKEEIEALLDSLNENGIRELELKQFLTENKQRILDKLSKCPIEKLIMNADNIEKWLKSIELKTWDQEERPKKDLKIKASDFFQWDLREKLLDLEEQLENGSLGRVNSIDRQKWRNNLQKKPSLSILDFSQALIEIAKGIEVKFLNEPLGISDKHQKKNDNSLKTFKNWEKSLLECTNYSQVYIYLQSLEESIEWSKSILNAKCKLCKKKTDSNKIKLCSQCDRAYHIYCLRPKLDEVPKGKWLCNDCRPSEKTPKKNRQLQNLSNDFDDERSISGSEIHKKSLKRERQTRNSKQKQIITDSDYESEDDKSSSKSSKKTKRSGSPNTHVLLSSTRHNQLEDKFKLAEKLVCELVKHEDSWPFLKQIPKKDAKEYLKLVNNKPMNLATIKNNLINYKYSSDYKLIMNDLKLIFTNCNLYYDETSDEYKSGKILFDYFTQQATQYGLI